MEEIYFQKPSPYFEVIFLYSLLAILKLKIVYVQVNNLKNCFLNPFLEKIISIIDRRSDEGPFSMIFKEYVIFLKSVFFFFF